MTAPLYLIDSTLREGEQFATAHFTTEQKLQLVDALSQFGIDYIEVTSPRASQRAFDDCRAVIAAKGTAKVLTHIRCNERDAELALACGVDGVNLMFGTSHYLQRYSHGRDLDAIIAAAERTIGMLVHEGVEVRFSAEDSLRTPIEDLYRVYEAVDRLGVQRVGVADTVGVGTPHQIFELIRGLRARVAAQVEFHGHNDTGCAVANAHAAWRAGAVFIDTTILGIGERNGITPMAAFIARVHAEAPHLTRRYRLDLLPRLDQMVAEMVGVAVPFNSCITGSSAFVHKAGIHTKAVLANPATYEILRPEDFGLDRQVLVGHGLVGRHALAHRAGELGLRLDEAVIDRVTSSIKNAAAIKPMNGNEVDDLLMAAAREHVEVAHVAHIG